MKIGYARVSTQDQKLDLQLDDLKMAKCDKIYQEKISSSKERPQVGNNQVERNDQQPPGQVNQDGLSASGPIRCCIK